MGTGGGQEGRLDPLEVARGARDGGAAQATERTVRPARGDAQRREAAQRDRATLRREHTVAQPEGGAVVADDRRRRDERRLADEERAAHREHRDVIARRGSQRARGRERKLARSRVSEGRRGVVAQDRYVGPVCARHTARRYGRTTALTVRRLTLAPEGAARQTQDRMARMLGAMRFLFATDGSRGADVALDLLCALPLAGADHVTILTVPNYSFMGTDVIGPRQTDLLRDRGEASARAVAEAARQRLGTRGVPVGVELRTGPVIDAIQAAALEHAVDLVVIGSRGLGALAGTLLGSVARGLARYAIVPVLVVRERRDAPRRILAAVDGSDDARAAVALLARMPLPSDAAITLVHVVEPGGDERDAQCVLAQAASMLRAHPIDHAVVERGHAAEQILTRAAATGTDLVVLGSRGQTQAGGFLQGSVADQVISQAHCAVLVAKALPKPRVVAEPFAMPRTTVAV